ncbi:methylmalonyl-CoA mutase subunit beta [Jejuia pallidilutea]|uniref:Methylmalonyl-CoA mutase n=1 Tax=Jejuia pallidilutea TaxID=504487 RepID=A0A090W2U7_9FLAO|nr:methylmalonyl-CoA mutase subunit beta [Jejuia pallidilutea]GAL67472.1 methylmalonyl-CoA mutase [Jejuia pallidilutea]GAL71271.1 methylmalonyl-CoA mutase [Jejuia pallidilutea]GAL88748.1 methylmalonyl-CoA mutase [Jejuia pallidilutea]
MSNSLFNEFEPVSAKQWKQKIQFDLKGADYNDALVWTSNEGIQVKPFYHAEDITAIPKTVKTKTNGFKICETLFVANAKNANTKAQTAILSGANSIKFIIPSKTISLEELLKDINLNDVAIHFQLQFLSLEYLNIVSKISKTSKIYIHTDIIGQLAKSGNWFFNLKEDFLKFKSTITHLNSFSIHTDLYQNAGANMVQQLAYAMAHANEYFNYIENTSKEITSKTNIVFNVAIGSNYFFEIAKLRALKLLFNTLKKEYLADYNCHIFATPSKRNKAIYDYNTNMLRTTTECMSAILGGADTISNLPYDAVFKKHNNFGARIARNQLLILKHESYFTAVNNPSDGSYYIESLTEQLAEKALILFKDIEANGGFLKQLKNGTIQRKIKESANKEQEQFNTGNEVVLGSNKHPNTDDKMKDNLEIYPFVKVEKRKTLIAPIIEKRLTENLEQERLKKE